jgi:hypothetical protein
VADESGHGWIACTTDSILAMKDTLWDMLITMPPPYSSNAKEKAWPAVECPRGIPIKATQRDRRRFLTLRSGLARLSAAATAHSPDTVPIDSPRSESSTAFRLSTATSTTLVGTDDSDDALDKIVDSHSWAALAYSGFMWWASAGEQGRSDEADEASRDAALLADLTPPPHTPSMSMPTPSSRTTALSGGGMLDSVTSLTARRSETFGAPSAGNLSSADEAKTELAMIAYFHRLTTQILSVMADVVDAADELNSGYEDDADDDEVDSETGGVEDVLLRPGEEGGVDGDGVVAAPAVRVDSRAVENMGLDVWNAGDAAFVREAMAIYFGRRAYVEGKGVEVCGVRVC